MRCALRRCSDTNQLIRAVATGAVVGGRSATGLAVVALSSSTRSPFRVERFLADKRKAVVVGACGELVADKLPSTPSRLSPGPFSARLLIAAIGGGSIARQNRRAFKGAVATHAVAAATACAIISLAATKWRSWSARRFDNDLPGALVEDMAVIAAASTLVRTSQ